MKKSVVILGLLFGIVLFSSFALAANPDVVYIYRSERRIDMNVIGVLSDMNLDVHLMSSKEIKTADFSEYEAIYIGDERLRNLRYLPDFPLIVLNRYYGRQLGLVSRGGISKMAANRPLKVLESEESIQVYDSSRFKRRRINIPYYYIRNKYLADGMQTIAKPDMGYKRDKGSTIVYSTQGTNKCFFGVTKSDYWTEEAEQMFRDCVGFVLNGVEEPEPPLPEPEPIGGGGDGGGEEGVHDVEISLDYANSVNGIQIKDKVAPSGEYILDSVAQLYCGEKYEIKFKTVNKGDFIEDISIQGILQDFEWTASRNLDPEEYSYPTKTITIDEGFNPGDAQIVITSTISEDATPEDNTRSRSVEIVC